MDSSYHIYTPAVRLRDVKMSSIRVVMEKTRLRRDFWTKKKSQLFRRIRHFCTLHQKGSAEK